MSGMWRRWLLCVVLLAVSCRLPSAQYEDDGFEDAGNGDGSVDPYGGGGGDPYGGGGGYGGGMDPYGGGGYGDPYGGGGGGAPPKNSARELDSTESILSFIAETDDQTVVIGYFDSSTNEADLKLFSELAETDASQSFIRYGYTTTKEVLEEKKYDGCAVLVYLPSKYYSSKDEKPKARYPSKTISSLNSLRLFVRQKSVPFVGEMTIALEKAYRLTGLPVVSVFAAVDLEKNKKGYQYIVNRVKKVAKNWKGKVLFNIANSDDFSADLESKFGIKSAADKKAAVSVGLRDGTVYYHLEKDFSVEALAQFVDDFKAGKLTGEDQADSQLNEEGASSPPRADPYSSHSEESDDEPSAVVTLTNSNFQDAVYGPDTDVLLEFYAPWCGHCKQLKPEYKQVAKAFQNDANIVVAAMDATAHQVPAGFEVQGYPTVLFLPASNKKSPVAYEGPRDAASMISYIRKHRTSIPSTDEL